MKKLLFVVAIFALLLRLFLSVNSKHGDMYNNWDWGSGMWQYGPVSVYEVPQSVWPHSWPNQPPGSLYLHAFSFWLNGSMGYVIWHPDQTIKLLPSRLIWWWQIAGPLVSLKLPSILADFVLAWTIYQFGKLWHHPKFAIFIALVYLFNPALWYNSAYWGQSDSIVAAFSMLSLLFLVRKQLILSPIFLGLSLVTKASWAPLVPFYFLYWWKAYRTDLSKLLLTPLTVFTVSIPFHPYLDLPFWLSRLYLTRIITGESAWITVIAFNFWNLFFAPSFTPVTIPIFGIPALYIAWGLVAAFYFLISRRLLKHPTSSQNFIYLVTLLFFMTFLFAPKMLQRYLYPVFPLLSVSLIIYKNKFVWFIYGLISMCYLANMYYQWWSPGIFWLEGFYTPLFTHLISIIYLSAFGYLYAKKTV